MPLTELKYGGSLISEPAPYHFALTRDKFTFYRNGKNDWNKDYLKTLKAMVATTSFTKLLIVSDKKQDGSDVNQTFYMEGEPRDLRFLVNILQLTDARCKGQNNHTRSTIIYVHEAPDDYDLEEHSRGTKSIKDLKLMKGMNFGVISVNGKSQVYYYPYRCWESPNTRQ